MPLRRTLLWLVACASLGGAAPASALDGPMLRTVLDREADKLGAAAGFHVVEVGSGQVLFSRRPDLPLVPASNEKLFVTATALIALGPDARRQTRVVGAAPDANGLVVGDLGLIGDGDPGFANSDLTGLADALIGRGLREVTGGVVGDEALLDGRRGSVDSAFKADLDLGGQLGALVIGHGVANGGGPASVVATRLQALLEARGVRFGRGATAARAPSPAEELAADPSAPMAELVRVTNTDSDNFYAELLLKVLGAEAGGAGSTAAGAAVVRTTLAGFGLRPTIVDGSGLTRRNRTSARDLVTLLTAMRTGPAASAWLGSMTVAGRTGTLRRRMRGTAAASRCAGKTGTLRGVSALSGYCTTTTGRIVAFSFLANGVGFGAKRVEDVMVSAVARYSG